METVLSDGQNKNNRAVAIWLLIGVGMTVVQILLGGITRLTGSGLSITEWNVVTGTLPPIGEARWLTEFGKYQQTPQYKLLNADFSLGDFKFIFFWEWFHRLWARLIGVVFALGFVYFFLTRKFKKDMVKPLIILFFLGGMQGAIGWIMVASGLDGDAVYVKPTRLALHFTFALFLLSYTFWFALKLLVPKKQRAGDTSLQKINIIISVVLVLQLLYGALMAGHKAATAAPTWPSINGQTIPIGLYKNNDGLLNFINNKVMVHFIHRGMAYLLVLLVIWWSIKAYKMHRTAFFNKTKWLPLGLIFLQLLLGIGSVLTSKGIVPNRWGAFEWMAQLHQFTGMLFLLAMIWMLFINREEKLVEAF